MPCQFLSGAFEALLQVAQQVGPPRGIALLRGGGEDAVGAEESEILAQLAPGAEHTRLVEETELQGPDGAATLASTLVGIRDGEAPASP